MSTEEPNDFENVDEGFDDDEIEHEELKDDDPPEENQNDKIPTMDSTEAPTNSSAATSSSLIQEAASAVIEGIRKEMRDSQGTMTLPSVCNTMLTEKNSSNITLTSFIVGCKTLNVRATDDNLKEVYKHQLSVRNSSSKTPGFVELYLFITGVQKKNVVMKAIATLKNSMMSNMTASSAGDFGLQSKLQRKFKKQTDAHNQDVRELLKDEGLKVSSADWKTLASSFADPLVDNPDPNDIHWPSFVAIVDPKGSNNSTAAGAALAGGTETKDDVMPDGEDVLGMLNGSPLEKSWKLLSSVHGKNSVDYRFPSSKMTTSELKKFLKSKSKDLAKQYSSDYELSSQGCFDVRGDGTLDVEAYASWSMRRKTVDGSPDYFSTLLKVSKKLEGKGKKGKGNVTRDKVLKGFADKMDEKGTVSEKEFTKILSSFYSKKDETAKLIAELSWKSEEDDDDDDDEDDDDDDDSEKKKKKKKKKKSKSKPGVRVRVVEFGLALASGFPDLSKLKTVFCAASHHMLLNNFDPYAAIVAASKKNDNIIKIKTFQKEMDKMQMPLTMIDIVYLLDTEMSGVEEVASGAKKLNYRELFENVFQYKNINMLNTNDIVSSLVTCARQKYLMSLDSSGSSSSKKKKKAKKKNKKKGTEEEDVVDVNRAMKLFSKQFQDDVSRQDVYDVLANSDNSDSDNHLSPIQIVQIINVLDPLHTDGQPLADTLEVALALCKKQWYDYFPKDKKDNDDDEEKVEREEREEEKEDDTKKKKKKKKKKAMADDDDEEDEDREEANDDDNDDEEKQDAKRNRDKKKKKTKNKKGGEDDGDDDDYSDDSENVQKSEPKSKKKSKNKSKKSSSNEEEEEEDMSEGLRKKLDKFFGVEDNLLEWDKKYAAYDASRRGSMKYLEWKRFINVMKLGVDNENEFKQYCGYKNGNKKHTLYDLTKCNEMYGSVKDLKKKSKKAAKKDKKKKRGSRGGDDEYDDDDDVVDSPSEDLRDGEEEEQEEEEGAKKNKKGKNKDKKKKKKKKALYVPKKDDKVWIDDYKGDGSKAIPATILKEHGTKPGQWKVTANNKKLTNIPIEFIRKRKDSDEVDDDNEDDDSSETKSDKTTTNKQKNKKKNKKKKPKFNDDGEEVDYDEDEEGEDLEEEDEDTMSVDEWHRARQDRVLRQAFDQIDSNSNGTVDQREMGVALRAMGAALTEQEMSEAMAAADDDGDGLIDFNEFRRAMRKRLISSKRDLEHQRDNVLDRIMKMFRALDTNRNGSIQASRFKLILTKVINIPLTKREWSALKEEIDITGNGEVDEEEFLRVWRLVNVPPLKNDNHRRHKSSERWYTHEDIGASAARGLKKLALGPLGVPDSYINIFGKMPSNFRQSCLAPLDSDERFTAAHMLSGAHDVSLGNEMLAHRGEGKVSSTAFDRPLRQIQNEKSINIIISLKEARGVPLPSHENSRDSIRSRKVRVCLMRGGRSTVGGSAVVAEGKSDAGSDSGEGMFILFLLFSFSPFLLFSFSPFLSLCPRASRLYLCHLF